MNESALKWLHITAHTYGVWLPGDPRGFRTRKHHEHIEGDYKNPPAPGTYDARLLQSQQLLKQEPVILTSEWRTLVGRAIRDRFLDLGGQAIAVSMSRTHSHLLVKMLPWKARDWTGQAKKHAWFVAHEVGWIGQMWARLCHVVPIRDRQHQLNTFDYIVRHREKENAWVWTFRDALEKTTITRKKKED